VLGRVRAAFASEFRVDVNLRRQLGDRYRHERAALQALLDPGAGVEGVLAPGLAVLSRRSQRWAPVMSGLRAAAEQSSRPLTELAVSLLHMHANRLLSSAHRAQEMVLYDYLTRLYESRMAQAQEGRGA
jgi:thiopeptide-type bacteriocin biosynthesis protein